MKLICLLMIYKAMTVHFIPTSGHMFDFHFITTKQNVTNLEYHCKEMEYDGLAVISSPEAHAITRQLTQHSSGQWSMHTYLGAHYHPEAGVTLWDDGTTLTSDYPVQGALTDPALPYARINQFGRLGMRDGTDEHYGLCGNHKNSRSESKGRTVLGGIYSKAKILSVSGLFSYLECAVLCGMSSECRAAEFNSDLLTCTLVGEYSKHSTSITDPKVLTYIRKTFS